MSQPLAVPLHAPAEPVAERLQAELAADRRKGGAGVVVAWIVSLAVLAAAAWAFVRFAVEITAFWPPVARLYALIGRAGALIAGH